MCPCSGPCRRLADRAGRTGRGRWPRSHRLRRTRGLEPVHGPDGPRYGRRMTDGSRPATRTAIPAHRYWVPRQHGAWAMLLLPVLLGVAASQAAAWQLAVGGAALSAYLASATIQAWSRSRARG